MMMNSTKRSSKQPTVGYLAFSSSRQGASHIKAGKVCQDAAFARCREGDKYAIAIVSDGHGGSNYFRSNRGSDFAVKVTQEVIGEYMKNYLKVSAFQELIKSRKVIESSMFKLKEAIVCRWRLAILQDYQRYPFTEEELTCISEDMRKKYEANPETCFVKAYGATLIVVVLYPNHFWFGLQIGDGKCVVKNVEGEFSQPIPWDDKCFLNVTTSLCDEKPLANFRHCFHTDQFPLAVFVGTDGVDDCFANDEDLYGFYQEVIQTFREKNYKIAIKEIDDFLPVMSQKGSGDDISVGGIIKEK